MAKITQKQVIEQIKELKTIKPRPEWVVLAKSQVFNGEPVERVIQNPVRKASIFGVIKSSVLHRKLAYSFVTLAFIFVGLVGFAQHTMPGDLLFPIKRITEQSQAALTGQTASKQSAATLNKRINDLALAAKEGRKSNIPSTISEINNQASELTKDFKNNLITDQETVKEIAASLKTLADVPGADLTDIPEVKDLYQVVVENQIADLEEATLTEEQAEALVQVKAFYEEERYIEALEKILMINNSNPSEG